MPKKCEYIESCPFKHTVDAISKKWALPVINAIGCSGRLRFHELMDALIDISPKALSDMLRKLEAEGLVRRESFAEIPPRVEYILTEDGLELRDAVITPLLKWAAARNGGSRRCHPACQRTPVPMWMHSSRDANSRNKALMK
ncbi:MAG: HxlR-like helix-turn-helix [Methanosaeta sp. PtaU1.Bin060]|jgi:DNA-binding HxlR family transcriptional regulator|nr:MAG: HxlR-like helix-turn-helix [Methanosaeta sp. PtaU1.Bin060]